MPARPTRKWHSELVAELLRSEDATNVEEALLKLIHRRFAAVPRVLDPPVDLKMLASAADIQPKFNYVEMLDGDSARLRYEEKRAVIDVNKSHPRDRQRFSIAHEIGHKLLDKSKTRLSKARSTIYRERDKIEEEKLCNMIAALLLGFRPEILRPILDQREFSFETIDYLSQRFEVSFEATVLALLLTYIGTAAVLYCICESDQGRNPQDVFTLRRYYASESFDIPLHVDNRLPSMLALKRALTAKQVVIVRETIAFADGHKRNYLCQAKKMPFYMKQQRESGIVLLITAEENAEF